MVCLLFRRSAAPGPGGCPNSTLATASRRLLGLLFLSVTCLPIDAQEQVGSVQGNVVGTAGQPVAQAKVELRLSSAAASTTTDQAGRFRFPRLPPGAFELRVEHPAFALAASTGHLALGQALGIEVALVAVDANNQSPEPSATMVSTIEEQVSVLASRGSHLR